MTEKTDDKTQDGGGSPPAPPPPPPPADNASPFGELDDKQKAFAETNKIASPEDALRHAMVLSHRIDTPSERTLTLPELDADDTAKSAAMDAIYAKLGRPEAATDYELPGELKAVDLSDEKIKAFYTEGFHKLGLTTDQAKGAIALADAQMAEQAEALETAAKERDDAAEAALRKDWGEAYDERVKVATALAAERGEEFATMLDETGLGSNPEVIKLLYEFGKATQEPSKLDGLGAGDEPSKRPVSAIQDDLRAFENKNREALETRSHPDHAAAVKRRMALIEELSKAQGQGGGV